MKQALFSDELLEGPATKRDKLGTADEAIAAANETLAATDPSMSPDTASPGGEASARRGSTDGTVSMETEEEERDAERRQSHAAAASRTADSPKEAEGSMREYRNDLEYLEDSFKLIIITLRWATQLPVSVVQLASSPAPANCGCYIATVLGIKTILN